jgi:hypothetical protein
MMVFEMSEPTNKLMVLVEKYKYENKVKMLKSFQKTFENINLLLHKIDNDIRLGDSGYYTREVVLQEIKNILGE